MNHRSILRAVAGASLAAAAACAVSSYPTTVSRPAQDAPARFVRADSSAISGTPGSAACTSPIVDPRTSARLTMERATGGRGDYSAAAGAYGLRPGELLRVDCANGEPIGIVRG